MRRLNNAMSCEVVVFCPLEPPTDNMTIVFLPLGKSMVDYFFFFIPRSAWNYMSQIHRFPRALTFNAASRETLSAC